MFVATSSTVSPEAMLHGGTFLGLAVGCAVGIGWARWTRARSDYRRAKEAVPLRRQEAWQRWWSMVFRGAVGALLVAAVFLMVSR